MGDYTHNSYGVKLEMGSELLRRQFDPTAHDLDSNFRLTRFADLKGRGCKVQLLLNTLIRLKYTNYSSQTGATGSAQQTRRILTARLHQSR